MTDSTLKGNRERGLVANLFLQFHRDKADKLGKADVGYCRQCACTSLKGAALSDINWRYKVTPISAFLCTRPCVNTFKTFRQGITFVNIGW